MNPSMEIEIANHFADRLFDAVRRKKTPLVVGLDPRMAQLPKEVMESGEPITLKIQARSYQRFCCEVIDVIRSFVPAVKPQAAFFEQLGMHGMFALAQVVDHATAAGLLVIMDAKRGDIGSTAEAYAAAYLGRKPNSPWGCDALTVNPYLGDDSLTPFVNAARKNGAGIFVLAKTSNPGSKSLQEKMVDDRPVYSLVAEQIQKLAKETIGNSNYGIVGAVVGATYPEQLAELRQQMPNTPLLIPGLGAQGGTAKDVAAGFDEDGLGAVINSSRAIIFAYNRPEFAAAGSWQQAVESATRETIQQLAEETTAGKLR
jgi:orotidine-5'-phosphate decarboxylase